MPTTKLPPAKEKAHEIAKKIANERPLNRDKDTPESQVTGGFNQKSHPEYVDRKQAEKDAEDSAKP
jgi:hypothetical protein